MHLQSAFFGGGKVQVILERPPHICVCFETFFFCCRFISGGGVLLAAQMMLEVNERASNDYHLEDAAINDEHKLCNFNLFT